MPGCLYAPDLLAVYKMIRNVRTSMMAWRREVQNARPRQNSRFETILEAGGRGRTENNRYRSVDEISRSPLFERTNGERV